MSNIVVKAISSLIIIMMTVSMGATDLAEEQEGYLYGNIPKSNFVSNSEIIGDFYDMLDDDIGYVVNIEYDEQMRIINMIAKHGGEAWISRITYNEDGTYILTELEPYDGDISALPSEQAPEAHNNQAAAASTSVNADQKMVDSAVVGRIEEAQYVWNDLPEMREPAHIEAQVARADYCVVYPKSSFAKAYLENGNLSNGTNFRRTLKYTSPQMYGSDIIAVQRALMAYGFLDAADVKTGDYGYYGPSTYEAVKDYQRENGLSVDGIVGSNTIGKMFSSKYVNNKGQVSFEGQNRINVFRTKHNLVCEALAANVSFVKGDIVTEAYIFNAGLKENGGRADVVRKGATNYVWEVKPDTAYGKATGGPQVTTYVVHSEDQINRIKYKYCPLQYGTGIQSFYISWAGLTQIYVSNTCEDGFSARGVVFYNDRKRRIPVFDTEPVPVYVPKPNTDYAKITMPEPELVLKGLTAVGVAVTACIVIKGIIAIAAAAPTGGTSLILLCF